MIDIHSHVIFDVDDGSRNIDESLRMIAEAKNVGIGTVIATPHFLDHVLNPDKTMKNLKILLEHANDTGVEIKLGYEVVLHPLMLKGTGIVKQYTMNKTEYVLVEFPFNTSFELSCKVLAQIQQNGLIPIVAHPERIETLIKKRRLIRRLKDSGCLLQVNAGSITGYYGEKSKTVALRIIEKKLADFVASDAHKPEYYERYINAFNKVTELTDGEYAQKLFETNAQRLLGNPGAQFDRITNTDYITNLKLRSKC